MDIPIFQEIFEYSIGAFKEHLIKEDNNRIIFSGKYGIGKTRFLDHFFSGKNQQAIFGDITFTIYRLSPVNYSIAATEDVVNYLKYDIILEFLRKGYQFEENDFAYIDTFPSYFKKNFIGFLKTLVYMIPEVGKDTVESFEKIESIWEKFKVSHNEVIKSEGDNLADFMTTVEAKQGSWYSTDLVTKIIQKIINKEGQNCILIIDDLDRLDPEHIFRILNIFSAHLSDESFDTTTNKFGFQKIILVCDYNNIRALFHHRYGKEADFSGYIDKFYSRDIFYFDNKAGITAIIKNVFDNVDFYAGSNEKQFAHQLIFSDDFLYDFVPLFVQNGFINLRNILKLYGKKYDLHLREIELKANNFSIQGHRLPIIIQLKLLSDLVGDTTDFESACDYFIEHGFLPSTAEDIFPFLIIFLTYEDQQYLTTDRKSPLFVNWKKDVLAVSFQINSHRITTAKVFHTEETDPGKDPRILDDWDDNIISPSRFWSAMKDSVAVLHTARIIPRKQSR